MIEFKLVSLKLGKNIDKKVRTINHEGIICVPLNDLIQILADKELLRKLLGEG
jgi:hypothetical protein